VTNISGLFHSTLVVIKPKNNIYVKKAQTALFLFPILYPSFKMNSANESAALNNNDSAVNDRNRSLSLVSDVDEERQGSSKRAPALAAGEEKKWKRVMANRRSAKESRQRRKQLLSDLEGSVNVLLKENSSLAADNTELRKQLAFLLPQAHANMSLLSLAQSLQQASQRRFQADLLGASAFRPPSLMKGLAQECALLVLDQQSLLRQLQF
jgi:hypothetical protein